MSGRLGLRGRIALVAAAIFVLQTILLAVLNLGLMASAVASIQQNQAGLLRDLDALSRCDADPAGWTMSLDGGFVLYFLDAAGRPAHPDAPQVQVALQDEPGAVWGAAGGPVALASMIVYDTGRDAPCRYMLNVRPQSEITSRGLLGFWGGVRLLVGAAIVPAIVLLTAGPLVRRVRRLSRAAGAIVESDFEGALPESGRDELDELAHDFNQVAAAASQRIGELRRRDAELTNLLGDLAHDVRTPLATLKLGLGRDDPRRIASARAEVEYLDGLFANLARGIQLGATGIPMSSEPVSLNALVEHVALRYQLIAEDQEIALHFALPPETLSARGDSIALEQALGNLVHNAVKFARGNVAVLLFRREVDGEDERAVLEVRDDGPGFASTEIPHLKERRVQGARSSDERSARGRSGMGLGLAIADAVARGLGGSLALANDPHEGGAVAALSLPIAGE